HGERTSSLRHNRSLLQHAYGGRMQLVNRHRSPSSSVRRRLVTSDSAGREGCGQGSQRSLIGESRLLAPTFVPRRPPRCLFPVELLDLPPPVGHKAVDLSSHHRV